MKTLNECGDDYQQFLQYEDDVFVFSKGACHAFALELEQWFQSNGHEVAIFYISSEHPELAKHVVTKAGGLFWDVFGNRTYAELAHKWAKDDISRIRLVQHVGWISAENDTPNTSYLGLLVAPDFLTAARQRARTYIQTHASTFTPNQVSA
jgi:hypothetical protein